MTQKQNFRNTLLQHLDPATIQRLQLRSVELDLRQDLEVPGKAIRISFFEEGIGSTTSIFEDGFEVEVSMFGYESAVGISALMGTKYSLNQVFMQLAGHGYCSSLKAARKVFARHGDFMIWPCAMCKPNSHRRRNPPPATFIIIMNNVWHAGY